MKETKTFKNCAIYAWSKETDHGIRYMIDIRVLNKVFNIEKKDDYKKIKKHYNKLIPMVKEIDEFITAIDNALLECGVGQIQKIIKARRPAFIIKTQYGHLFLAFKYPIVFGPKIPEKIKENALCAKERIEQIAEKYAKALERLTYIVCNPFYLELEADA